MVEPKYHQAQLVQAVMGYKVQNSWRVLIWTKLTIGMVTENQNKLQKQKAQDETTKHTGSL